MRVAPALLALLAFATPASAGLHMHGSGGGGGSYTGPGDVASGAKEFWGLRAYSSAQADGTHTAINARNTGSGETCDILINTSGGLGNTTACSATSGGQAVATFCSGGCTIVTFYGQIGAKNYSQATTASQAALTFNCINSTLPCATFSGGQSYTITISATAQPLTLSLVAERTANFMTAQNILSDGSTSAIYFSATPDLVSNFFGGGFDVMAADGAFHAIQAVIDDAHSSTSMQTDGNAPSLGSAGSNGLALNTPLGGPSSNPNMKFTELILYALDASPSALHANQAAYWGTP